MKRIAAALLLAALAVLAAASTARAQAVDSTLVGHDILSELGSGTSVNQSPAMRAALVKYINANSAKTIRGYRIRVFYGSDRSAREKSESIAGYVRTTYPEVGVYRTFDSPNFKVCVGDFRTRDEALALYNKLRQIYPTSLIIKDNINYPTY